MRESFLSRAMNRHGDAVYRLALCRLQNLSDAEDVFQDTFLQLLQEKTVGKLGRGTSEGMAAAGCHQQVQRYWQAQKNIRNDRP